MNVQKQGNWLPHELKPRDVERRLCMSEKLMERHKNKSFLHRIVTGDEKWIHYDNPKRKKSYVKPGQLARSTVLPIQKLPHVYFNTLYFELYLNCYLQLNSVY